MIVNRANAYKLGGNAEVARDILEKEDWSATSLAFKISVAAVLGDEARALQLMSVIGSSGAVDVVDYREWPVFEELRKSRAFKDKFAEIFGVPVVAEPEANA